ncbi:universal stress protein [Halovenus halobia]|uniref:universal stress protein n=1 Tax=Halovenus halobia TaxID=3396622 RepID=UPI003F552105
MTKVLVGTDSVHTTAAACDYLDPRLGEADTVVFATVPEGPVSERDAGDAGNVARTRLIEPTVEIRTPDSLSDGETVTEALLRFAEELGADELLLGLTRGDPETAGDPPGSTVQHLLAETTLPVVVVTV